MGQHPQYGQLLISELAGAARLAVLVQILRGLQVLGPDSPARHAIYITFDPSGSGVLYPESLRDPTAPSVTVVLQHRYADLRVDWEAIAVTLSFRGQAHAVRIPFDAILQIADDATGMRVELPAARATADFHAAFQFALATLMVFQWGTGATVAELEGRALFALLPAIATRISRGTSDDAASAVIIFDKRVIGVSLPPDVAALAENLLSFTLSPGDKDVRVRSDKFIVECDGPDGENWMIVPFLAVQKITMASRALTLDFFPGPVADPLPGPDAPRDLPGAGLDLADYGTVTSPSRFPPGSFAQGIWEAGQFCLSAYVGRHSIPGLRVPEDLRERVPLGPSTSLEILIFDDPQHNAIAFKQGSRYCVGIYHGLLNTIPAFAMALWTRPDVAPWIGDVSGLPPAGQNRELPGGLEALEVDKIYLRGESARIDPSRLQPAAAAQAREMERMVAALDPVRRQALLQCIEDAFRYIWVHEIGHVVWGHLDLFESRTNAPGMSELDDACGDAWPPELGQFLEFQTDRFAFGSVLNYRVGDLEQAAGQGRLAMPGRGMPAHLDQATIAIMGCVITHLIVATNLRLQGLKDVAGTHPPTWLRVYDMISAARSLAESLDPGGDPAPAEDAYLGLQDRINRAVSSIVATHPQLGEILQGFTEGAEANSAYATAFEDSVPKWDAVVRPYFKFYRDEGGKAALRD